MIDKDILEDPCKMNCIVNYLKMEDIKIIDFSLKLIETCCVSELCQELIQIILQLIMQSKQEDTINHCLNLFKIFKSK